MRIAVRPCHTVLPHQQVPSAWIVGDRRAASSSSSPNETSTWLSDDVVQDLVARLPQTGRRTASRSRQVRSTRSATPARPSDRSAAHTSTPRARRDDLGRVVDGVAVARSRRQVGRRRPPSRRRSGAASRTKAMPLSYGTLSHLWASVAHESAALDAAPRGARAPGAAAAHSPKAPSTWTQAPARAASVRTISAIGIERAGVHVAGLDADDGAGRRASGRASARMRPWSSTGTRVTRSRPSPSSASALNRLTWTSSPTTTVIGGAPNRPSASTSQPCRASSGVARRGQAVRLRHRGAGDEAHRGGRAAGRARRAATPPAMSLELGGGRRHHRHAGVLVPRRREPVGGERRRQGRRR